MSKTLSLLAVLFFVAGCASMDSVVAAKKEGEGVSKIYPVSSNQAWKIAKKVFQWKETGSIREHKSRGYMLTSTGWNFISQGTVMGAWIKPMGNGKTKVTVITKRKYMLDLFTSMTEDGFHVRFAKGVKIVKRGKRLPASEPE